MRSSPANLAAAPAPGPVPLGRRLLPWVAIAIVVGLGYLLRGVLIPLFLAFLLAYALDPFVARLMRWGLPRTAAAILVMLGIATLFIIVVVYAIPLFLDELRAASAALPSQFEGLLARLEPVLWTTLRVKLPHSIGEVSKAFGDKVQAEIPTMLNAVAFALFGTLSYVAVVLSALIVPIFALYILVDFNRIIDRVAALIPRRSVAVTIDIARQIHRMLGGYVRGQLTANIVLGALYATGLRIVDIRLAVPIGVMTGMLAFVPYVGFLFGLLLALSMATLDWHGLAPVLGVLVVMGTVQILDGLVITPRIVGRSVGLAPLEVLLTMMAAASLFGFLGVLLAVPLGAVVKIFVQRAARAYFRSALYLSSPNDTQLPR